jgi:hypothetical protein
MPLLPLISDPARTFQVGRLTDDGVLHDSVAEVIDYRRNGEDATQPFVQTFLRHGFCLACAWALSAAAIAVIGAAATASPATALRLVIEVETACAMVAAVTVKVG